MTDRIERGANASFIVDFVARGDSEGQWKLVLVEEGPWKNAEAELRRVQDRLYNCIEAAIDGQIATRFPETSGGFMTIQLHGYNLPPVPIQAFWQSFSAQVLTLPEYSEALKASDHVSSIAFELDLSSIH